MRHGRVALSNTQYEISTNPVREPFERRVPRLTDTGPEDVAVCSERILWAAARRTYPVVFFEMSLSEAIPEDVPATYVVSVRVAEPQQSVGCLGRGAVLHGTVGPPFKSPPIRVVSWS